LEHTEDLDAILKKLTHSLLVGYKEVGSLEIDDDSDSKTKKNLIMSLAYFRDRIGVPRDMSYPAARQLRAHLNHISGQI
jgi:glutathione S-transferase